jgi:hypothetical protein
MVGENGESGASLVEFALLAPMLVIMSLYTADFSLLFFRNMQLQNVAQASVDWAIANRVYNSNDISLAATSSTNVSTPCFQADCSITVHSYLFCGCPSTSGVTLAPGIRFVSGSSGAPCPGGNICPDGTLAGTYANVCVNGLINSGTDCSTDATKNYQSFRPYGLIAGSYGLKAQSMARIQ